MIMKFETRPSSYYTIIRRLKYNDRYIYYIKNSYGCGCGYAFCESDTHIIHTIKVRDIETEELIKTKNGLNKVKKVFTSNFGYTMTEKEVLKIYLDNY